jgi:hypothetical protein
MGPPRRGLACWDPSPRRSSHPRTASGTDLGAGLLGFIKKVRRDGLRSPSRGHGSCLVTAEDDLYSSMSLLQRLPRVTRASRRGVRPVAPPAGVRCRHKSVDWCFTAERGQSPRDHLRRSSAQGWPPSSGRPRLSAFDGVSRSGALSRCRDTQSQLSKSRR